jgi:hypothetical protein
MKEYEMLWRNKWLTSEAMTVDDMIITLRDASEHLAEMRDAGITLDPDGGTSDDYARLVTKDPEVAKKFGLEFYDEMDEMVYCEEQIIEICESGKFSLTFNGQTTPTFPCDATAIQIETALNCLSSIGGVGGIVSVDREDNECYIQFGGKLEDTEELLEVNYQS